jgi:hypothetical protein
MSVKIFDKAQNKWVIFPGSIGAPGRSAYELAVQQGYKGTLDEWLKSIKGADGRDAYTIAVEGGYKGTEEEYNNALTIAPVAVDKINNADTTPTKDSTNLVLSGGVKDAIDSLNSDFNADLATINSSITNLSDEIDNIVNVEIGDQLKSSIIDNLTSSDTEKALSARQGKILKELIDNLANLQITVVDTLPTTGESNIIYLVKKAGTGTDIHDEYVYVEGNWEKIGTTDVDLTNYYTKTQVDSIKDTLDNKISNNTLSITNITTNGSITPENLKIQKNGVDLLDPWNGSREGVANITVPTSLPDLNPTPQQIIDALGYRPADASSAGSGDVTGPTSSKDSNIVIFEGTNGKLIKDSGYNVGSFAVKDHTHTISQITDLDPITVDDTLSATSINPVQNKVVATALSNKVNNATLGSYVKTADLNVTLGNYYTTAEVYTKNEVDDKIGSAGGGDVMASGDLANNYIIIGAGSKSIKKSEQLLSDLALKSDIPSLDGYATESWVGTQNFITMPDDLAEDRIVIGAGTNSVTSKRLKTINGISLLVDDTYNVTNYNVSRMFPWDAFTGRGDITGLYNYLFDGVGQLVPIEYNNSAYTNLPVDGESFVGTLQPYKYTAANNWSVRAFLTSENTGKTYTGVFNMGQSALINWIEIGKDITSSEIISALGFTPISSNEIPTALPNPHALSITANRINNSYTGSSAVNINLDSIFSKKLKTVTTPGQPGIFVGTESSYEVSALYVSADEPDAIIVIPSSTSIAFNNTIYTEMQDLGTLTGGAYKCYCITYINSSIVLVNGAIYGNS